VRSPGIVPDETLRAAANSSQLFEISLSGQIQDIFAYVRKNRPGRTSYLWAAHNYGQPTARQELSPHQLAEI
jgi:hypothetical protein